MGGIYRDGEDPLRTALEQLTWKRQRIEEELAAVRRDVAEVEARLGRARASRGRAQLWVLGIPIAIIGFSLWGLYTPPFVYSRARAAMVGASVVRQAAELLMMDTEARTSCLTVDELVAQKRLDPAKAADPWGRPYHIDCSRADVHVVSAGKDGSFFTPDDIRDDLEPREMRRVADVD